MQDTDQLISLKDTTFVTSTYQALLGRPPDPEGMQYYLRRIRAGYSKSSLLVQIADSSEAQALAINLPGLNELRANQKKADHWFWGLFTRSNRIERQTHLLENEMSYLAEQCQRIELALYKQSMTLNSLINDSTQFKKDDSSKTTPVPTLAPSQTEAPNLANTAKTSHQETSLKPIEWPPIRSKIKTPLEEFGNLFL